MWLCLFYLRSGLDCAPFLDGLDQFPKLANPKRSRISALVTFSRN